MSENGENGATGGRRDLVPDVSEDRPLDSLIPEMGGGEEDLHENAPSDVDAVHPRVLEVGLEEGTEWTFACWEDPGAEGMNEQFVPLLEATILREMSRLPSWEREEERRFVGLRLLSFDSMVEESRSVLEHLGFAEEPWEADKYSERMSAWRQEAQAGGLDVPARPVSLWHLPIAHPEEEALDAVERRALEKAGEQVWGETPGAPSRHVAEELEAEFGTEIGLGDEGLETMQEHLVVDASNALRWMAPVFFQALCDYIGVCLHGDHDLRVQWGMCEPDPRGIVPPPMFRDPEARAGETIPIGQFVSNWCMMPVADGEAPDLAAKVGELAELIRRRR